jgi:hypothetical protein
MPAQSTSPAVRFLDFFYSVWYNHHMESVLALKARLRLEDIGKRLAAHEPRPKIGRDLNMRPDQLQKILHSDLFLEFLDEQQSPLFSEVAETIREEMALDEETDAEKLILGAEAEATKELLAQMRAAEKPSERRAAAIAVIELARKIGAGKKGVKAAQKMDIPASQLKCMLEAAREQDERPEPIHQNDGTGATVQPDFRFTR